MEPSPRVPLLNFIMTKTRKKVTEEEINFIIENDSKMTIAELCNKLGRSKGTVDKIRRKYELKKDDKTSWSDEEKNILKNNNRLTNKELAKLMNRTFSSVAAMRKYLNEKIIKICILCELEFVSEFNNIKICSKCYLPKNKNTNKKDSNNPLIRYSHYKSGAKKRNINFNLTEQEFYSFWKKSCIYCGDEIQTIGLDRINSGEGYDIDNVVPCCSTCNWMKIDKSAEDWITHIKKILNHMGETNAR